MDQQILRGDKNSDWITYIKPIKHSTFSTAVHSIKAAAGSLESARRLLFRRLLFRRLLFRRLLFRRLLFRSLLFRTLLFRTVTEKKSNRCLSATPPKHVD